MRNEILETIIMAFKAGYKDGIHYGYDIGYGDGVMGDYTEEEDRDLSGIEEVLEEAVEKTREEGLDTEGLEDN